jgi:hypothetical protein
VLYDLFSEFQSMMAIAKGEEGESKDNELASLEEQSKDIK